MIEKLTVRAKNSSLNTRLEIVKLPKLLPTAKTRWDRKRDQVKAVAANLSFLSQLEMMEDILELLEISQD